MNTSAQVSNPSTVHHLHVANTVAIRSERDVTAVDSRSVKPILKGIKWLLSRQNRDGSWGCRTDNVDRLLATCQVVTMLLDAGYNPHSPAIRKAVEFLTDRSWDRYASGHVVTYWRLEPFSRLVTAYPAVQPIIEAELRQVQQGVLLGRGPSRSFVLPLFAMKMAQVFRSSYLLPLDENVLVQRATEQWEGEQKCFADKIDMTSMGLAYLQSVDWPANATVSKDQILTACEEYIAGKANTDLAGTSWANGHVGKSAFVAINCCDDHSLSARMVDILDGVGRYLLSKQKRGGNWEMSEGERPPHIKSNDYYTALALRAIIAVHSVKGDDVSPMWSILADRENKASHISALLCVTLLCMVAVAYRGPFLSLLNLNAVFSDPDATDRTANYTLGLIGAFAALKAIWLKVTSLWMRLQELAT